MRERFEGRVVEGSWSGRGDGRDRSRESTWYASVTAFLTTKLVICNLNY